MATVKVLDLDIYIYIVPKKTTCLHFYWYLQCFLHILGPFFAPFFAVFF